ncbi:MAG: STAS domain-containing protein [Chloroflexi bacterium]|nr:STAS domain-containing protein [Chloroflexota bacterium]
MEIKFRMEQGRVAVTVMQPFGDINAMTYETFQARAKEVLDSGVKDLLIDLAQVPYISSAGLRALNQIHTWLEPEAKWKGAASGTYKSSHLRLLKPTARVLEILKMTGYDMYIEIFPELKSAVAAF